MIVSNIQRHCTIRKSALLLSTGETDMEQPLISVIVPVYNLEKLITDTLNTLINQQFDSYEIIVSDDASTDKTVAVAESVLQKSGRKYKVLRSNVNAGVSCARNRGLEAASGKYVLFLDGDDLFDSDMLKLLYDEAKRNGDSCDIVTSGRRELEKNTMRTRRFPLPSRELQGASISKLIKMWILNKWESSHATIYRRGLINSCHLRYQPGCIAGEDCEFFIKALTSSKKFAYIGECPYDYVQHDMMGCRQPKTKETKIKRYEDNAKAIRRYTKYIRSNSDDKELLKLLDTYLIPQTCHKILSVCAMKGDRLKFDQYLSKRRFRKLMWNSIHSFLLKPEFFLKSIAAVYFSNIYYRSYARRC